MSEFTLLNRQYGKVYYYDTIGRGLVINSFTYKENDHYYGFIKDWTYSDCNNVYTGTSQRDLIEFLKGLSYKIPKRYKKDKKTKEVIEQPNSINRIIIYTNNVRKAKGFLQPILTGTNKEREIKHFITVLGNIEIRDITQWVDDYTTAQKIARNAQLLYNDLFIPEKEAYLTSSRWPRQRIKHALGSNKIASRLMPSSYSEYVEDRKAIFGGLHFVKRIKWTYEAKNDILIKYFDLTSAYPYIMVSKKYPMTEMISVNETDYKMYNDDPDWFTIGTYRITYNCRNSMIATFKDYNGNKLLYDQQDHTIKIRCCDTDLTTISKICDSIKIECLTLEVSEMNYLPQEIVDEVLFQFKKKEELRGCGIKYELRKKVVNGISGDLTRKAWENEESEFLSSHKIKRFLHEHYEKAYKQFLPKCIYSMYWGIQVTAYVRAILQDIAMKTDAIYGDTDGLFFYGYEENLKVIDLYNKHIDESLASRGINIDKLGRFKEEDDSDIVLFKAFHDKTYTYESIKSKRIVKKIAGMSKEYQELIDSNVFKRDYTLDYGTTNKSVIVSDYICINGFESDGYYYETKVSLDSPEALVQLSLDLLYGRIE